MAKKAKLDLSGEGLKKLALEHCEKVVFGICAVLLLLLAYWGYQRPVFDDEKDNPKSLIASSKRSQSKINSTQWESDDESMSFAKFRVADLTVPKKVEDVNSIRLSASAYPAFPVGEISLSTKPKRVQPELVAATDVRAQFAYHLYAISPEVPIGSRLINSAAYAPPAPKKAPKKKRTKKKQNDPTRFGSGMEEGDQSGDDMQSPGSGGSGSGMGMPSSGGGGTGPGRGSNKPDGPVKEVPATMLAEMEGVLVSGKIPELGDKSPSVVWRQTVCVTALVPFKEQVEKYEKALKGSKRYDPGVDIPRYIGLVVWRRVNGGDWEEATDEIMSKAELVSSVSYPPLIEGEEFDPFLNASIPTILKANFDDFVMHPKSTFRDFLVDGSADDEDSKKDDESDSSSTTKSFEDFNNSSDESSMEDENGDFGPQSNWLTSENAAEFKQVRFFDVLANNNIKPNDKLEYKVSVILSNPNLPLSFVMGEEGSRRQNNTGGFGGSMRSGQGSGSNLPGGGDRSGLMGAGGGSGSGAMMPGSGSGAGSGAMMPGSGGGASGGASSGGYSGGSGGGRNPTPRTAELTLEMLGNPNITDSDLDGSIRQDILDMKTDKPVEATDKGLAQRFGMITPESPVSNAVTFVVPGDDFVGGGAKPQTLRRANNVMFLDSEPAGELVLLKRNREYQLRIPGKAEVYAGSPMVFDARAEVFNPLDLSVRWIGPEFVNKKGEKEPDKRADFQFDSKAIVLDVKPSRELENSTGTKEEFLSPAEVLVFDGAGGFTLRNELDDLKAFRHAMLVEDEAAESGNDSGTPGFGNRGGLSGSGGGSPDLPGFGN